LRFFFVNLLFACSPTATVIATLLLLTVVVVGDVEQAAEGEHGNPVDDGRRPAALADAHAFAQGLAGGALLKNGGKKNEVEVGVGVEVEVGKWEFIYFFEENLFVD
jgi:hypothetical protein